MNYQPDPMCYTQCSGSIKCQLGKTNQEGKNYSDI